MTYVIENDNVNTVEASVKFSMSVNTNPKQNIQKIPTKLTQDEVRACSLNADKSYSKIQEFTIESFTEYLKEGNLINPDVLRKSCQLIIFDIDNDAPGSFVESPFTAWRYPSPSYQEGVNNRHRLVTLLSRPVPIDEVIEGDLNFYAVLVAVIGSEFPKYKKGDDEVKFDACCQKNRQFYWGVKNPDTLEFFPEFQLVPVDELKEAIPELYPDIIEAERKRQNKPKKDDTVGLFSQNISEQEDTPTTHTVSSDSGTTKILKVIYKDIWVGVCKRDINKLYCRYSHNLAEQPREPGMFFNASGRCYGSQNPNGNAFWVAQYEYGLPPVWIHRDDNLKKGNILGYWLMVGKAEKVYPEDMTLKGNGFIRVVTDLFNHFGVELPKSLIKKKATIQEDGLNITWLCNKLCEDLKDTLFIAGWEGLKESAKYYYFDGESYDVYCLTELSKKLKTIANQKYPEVEERLIERSLNEKGFKFKGLHTEICNWFAANEAPLTKLSYRPDSNWRYFPFSNGLYDTVDKKLIPNDGRAFNTKIICSEYSVVSDDNPGVLALKSWLKNWMQLDVKADYLLSYAVICSQGRANEIKSFPLIYGNKGTGKSSFGSTIASLFSKDLRLVLINSKEPLNPTNNHNTASLENKFLWTLKEIGHSDSTDLNKLLDYFGEDNQDETISINPKQQEVREVPKLFGLIADSENKPSLPKGKEGFYRRFKFMESYYYPQAVNFIAIIKEHKESVFNWMLQQDFNTHKDIITACENHEYFQQQAKTIQRENSDLAAFIEDCFDISNEEIDAHIHTDLYHLYRQWAIKSGEKVLSVRSFGKFFKKTLLTFDWLENTKESNGKTKYRGFKCKPEIRGYNMPNVAIDGF